MLHTTDYSRLFLQYLSTGQFECARLVFLCSNDKTIRSFLFLILSGHHPQDWVYTATCPSFPHLAWFCARLLHFTRDLSSIPSFLPPLSLSGHALLAKAGFHLQDGVNASSSVVRTRALANFLLADFSRLSHLLSGPWLPLSRQVLVDLEPYFVSDEDVFVVVDQTCALLVVENRLLDAIHMFAICKRISTCPSAVATRINKENKTQAVHVMLNASCLSFSKHASLFRHLECSTPLPSVQECMLESLRNQQNGSWFIKLSNDPYAFADAPRCVKQCFAVVHQQKHLFSSLAAPLLENELLMGNVFTSRMQFTLNRLAFCEVVQHVLHALKFDDVKIPVVAAGDISWFSLLAPLLSLPQHEIVALDVVAPPLLLPCLSYDWLIPEERREVILVQMACWTMALRKSNEFPSHLELISRKEKSFFANFLLRECNFVSEQRNQVILDLSPCDELLHQEVTLRAELRGGLNKLTCLELLSLCFSQMKWTLAIELAKFFPIEISSSPMVQRLVEEAHFFSNGGDAQDLFFQHQLGANVGHQGDDAMTYFFTRHQLAMTELVKLGVTAGADEFVVHCTQRRKVDPCSLLLEFHRSDQDFTLVSEKDLMVLTKQVLLRCPFPSEASTNTYLALMGCFPGNLSPAAKTFQTLTCPENLLENVERKDSNYTLEEEKDVFETAAQYLALHVEIREEEGNAFHFSFNEEEDSVDVSKALKCLEGESFLIQQGFWRDLVNFIVLEAKPWEMWMWRESVNMLVKRFELVLDKEREQRVFG